jgi:hypothetical protein
MFPHRKGIAALAIVYLAVIAGCGGGGSSSGSITPSPLPTKNLSWIPPTAYTDGTPLNPATDLDIFEIYVKQSGPFTSSDSPVALVGAVSPSTGQLVTSFNLANLGPFITPGIQYQVALRAVAIAGTKSGFSGPATFSF